MIFSIIQLADLHIVGHDANDIECHICQLSIDNSSDGFLTPEVISITTPIEIPIDTVVLKHTVSFVYSTTLFNYNNKAPPRA